MVDKAAPETDCYGQHCVVDLINFDFYTLLQLIVQNLKMVALVTFLTTENRVM